MYGSVGGEKIFLIHTCVSSKCTVLVCFDGNRKAGAPTENSVETYPRSILTCGYDALSQRVKFTYTEMVLFSNTKMLIFSEFSELSTLLGNYTVFFRAYQRLILY